MFSHILMTFGDQSLKARFDLIDYLIILTEEITRLPNKTIEIFYRPIAKVPRNTPVENFLKCLHRLHYLHWYGARTVEPAGYPLIAPH
jgi:hypothetical protein